MRKLILTLVLLAGIVYADTDIRQREKERRQREVVEIESKINYINESPARYLNERVDELDRWINKLPYRKAGEGRITMKQYLTNLKSELHKDPDKYITNELQRLNKVKEDIENEKIIE